MFNIRSGNINSAIGYFLFFLLALSFGRLAVAKPEIAKVMGPSECGECHKKEMEAERNTRHFSTFYKLARKKNAKKIAKNLGIKRVKKESECVSCHFTQQLVDGNVETIAGISCESCHGAAKDWIDVHNDYGGKEVKKAQETAAHKKMRITTSINNGMISPSDIYSLANNCYQCHLVPNEKLVNKGGHKAGSAFELVRWSQGEVRHNFFSSASGEDNIEASKERKRMLYILGNALELEHALRAISKATQRAKYAVTMAKRVKLAIIRLDKIAALITVPEVNQLIETGKTSRLKLNNEAELSSAADKVGQIAKSLSQKYNGSEFAAVDALIPAPSKFKGSVTN